MRKELHPYTGPPRPQREWDRTELMARRPLGVDGLLYGPSTPSEADLDKQEMAHGESR